VQRVFLVPKVRCPLSLLAQAFFITLKERDAKNWTSYARHQIDSVRAATGINQVHTIYGDNNTKFGDLIAKSDPQIGLSLAHLQVWETIVQRRLKAAWIFEDDVVFHTNFVDLFPTYWSEVPYNYQLVWLGHLPISGSMSCESPLSRRLFHQNFVWCTHAMIVSYEGAKFLARAMQGIINMAIKAERIPHFSELKIDLFIIHAGSSFATAKDLKKWIIFDPTPTTLASWGGVSWCNTRDFLNNYNQNGSCCETCDIGHVQRHAEQGVPLLGTGLAYQNLCKEDPWKLEEWNGSREAGINVQSSIQ